MKKLTLLVVMAVLCPFLSKEKGTKSKDDITNNKERVAKYIVTLLLIIFYGFAALAQEPQTISPLKVGDKVPESFWQLKSSMLNSTGDLQEVKLIKFKNKGLLIDFWACWCGSCIVKFPLLDSIQIKFAEQFNILPVNTKTTRDSHIRIQELLAGNTNAKFKFSIPTVVDDEIIAKLFPHKGLPHYVWINQSGIVKAITMSFLVKEENIKQMLAEDQ